MDVDKKKLANERRLKAVQEWQKKGNQTAIKNTRVIYENEVNSKNLKVKSFDSDDGPNSKQGQLKLFESDDDDDDNDFSGCFKIRPQFEGKNGLQMLELSSELSDRFKLDERFKEEEPLYTEEDQENTEKNKNIRILESILGHEVSKKHSSDINLKRKRGIERFDPENKEGTSYFKDVEKTQKKSHKKKRKNETVVSNEEVPNLSERYIEVSSNLKDIMNSTGTFSFSEKFKLNCNNQDATYIEGESNFNDTVFETKDVSEVEKIKSKEETSVATDTDFENNPFLKDLFFIADSDERLKEGIEFFRRQKSEEEVRNDWLRRRDAVLDIFKRRKRSAQRGFLKKPKQIQRKPFPNRK